MSQAAVKKGNIHVRPNAGGFGAEITGADLRRPLDAATVADIRRAWLDHQVVFFPDQPLSLDELECFTLAFGAWGRTDFIKPVDGHPNVLELRREPDERSSNFGAGWHSDYSFQEAPPAATLLLSKIVPPVGGRTLFADGYRAYDALPEQTKKRIAGLRGIHSAVLPYSKEGFYANEGKARSMTIVPSDDARKTRTHPVVRIHPETGRKALFVNQVYTIGIDGLPKEEGDALLRELCAHSVSDEFLYRHPWQPDMLLMWDNRCVQHFAEGGYDGHRRLMYRTTIAGDAPH
ncbi:MAG: TauD/TfdA family dioxygenase [Parvibaculum sp.]|uniref:TauD/TfdA dioxygenase family protein n=1 Tax=Parvibaculum sp. TaxID=2024848 RepID=UPI002717A70B|nr:TauD/TfdA family dioxygenase [Parvibaculum sp.]MDO8838603.1 TauD/TfdA family dioxygenase [Parvibaculum sp.]